VGGGKRKSVPRMRCCCWARDMGSWGMSLRRLMLACRCVFALYIHICGYMCFYYTYTHVCLYIDEIWGVGVCHGGARCWRVGVCVYYTYACIYIRVYTYRRDMGSRGVSRRLMLLACRCACVLYNTYITYVCLL